MVALPCGSAAMPTIEAFTGAVRFTRNVSLGSMMVSPTTRTVRVCVSVPGANESTPLVVA
jgi:hypothetical protein